MLARIYPDATTAQGKAEAYERIRTVAHNYPEVLAELQPSARQLHNAAKQYGLQPEPGTSYTDLPILSVNGPLVTTAVENFSRKLFCALYYKHTSMILPLTGGIAVRWFSNIQLENDEIPQSLADILAGCPKLERAKTSLDEQFFYGWGVADTKALAAFLAFFRQSFAILGYVNRNAHAFRLPPDARIVQPFIRA
jgi:hypothetical protein